MFFLDRFLSGIKVIVLLAFSSVLSQQYVLSKVSLNKNT